MKYFAAFFLALPLAAADAPGVVKIGHLTG